MEPISLADGIRAAAYNSDPDNFLADVAEEPRRDFVALARRRWDEVEFIIDQCRAAGGVAVEALPHLVRVTELFRSIASASFSDEEPTGEIDAGIRKALSGLDRVDARSLIDIGDRVQAAAPLVQPKPTIDDDAMLTAVQIAEFAVVSLDSVRAKLKRWQQKHLTGWVENTERGPREARYLYRWGSIKDLFSPQATSERPAK